MIKFERGMCKIASNDRTERPDPIFTSGFGQGRLPVLEGVRKKRGEAFLFFFFLGKST